MSEAMTWMELRAQRRSLRAGLWAAQIALAALFGVLGVMKIVLPMSQLAARMHWPGLVPEEIVRFDGVAELLGAIGLVVPAATRIWPQLTTLAAGGLVTIMIFAGLFNASILDFQLLPLNTALGCAAGFVAWGRWKAAPIAPRS
jgi:hypothetical protein